MMRGKDDSPEVSEDLQSQQRKLSYAMQDEANDFYFQNIAHEPIDDLDQNALSPKFTPENSICEIKDLTTPRDRHQDEEQKNDTARGEKGAFKISKLLKDEESPRSIRRNSEINLRKRKLSTQSEEEEEGEENIEEEDSSLNELDRSSDVPSSRIRDFPASMSRTRNRSYDEKKGRYQQDTRNEDNYFSIQRDGKLNNLSKNKREMGDIRNEQSISTSYHMNEKSFKWSTQLKYPSITHKKGIMISNYQLLAQREKDIKSQSANYSSDLSSSRTLQQSTIKDTLNVYRQVENYSSRLTSFLEKFQQMQLKDNFTSNFQFEFFSKLDKGSFGQVDLYFMEADDSAALNMGDSLIHNTSYSYSDKNHLHLHNFEGQHNQSIIDKSEQQSFSFLSSKKSTQFKNSTNFINMQSTKNNNLTLAKEFSQASTQMCSLDKKEQQSMSTVNQATNFKQVLNTSQNTEGLMNSLNTSLSKSIIPKKNILPVAGKKIKIKNEFIRELYIMQTVESEYMPKLLSQDIEQQVLFMELGLCSLYDLKLDSQKKKYKMSDDFTYSILINLFRAIESLLQNYNYKEQKSQALFHSDIKPQNIILTVKQNQDNQSEVKLLLIDYGGSSFSLEDYWSYFTPGFVSEVLWQKLVNSQHTKAALSWPEVRYAEVYAACRAVQYLILDQNRLTLFKKHNGQDFIDAYKDEYPKTSRILENVFFKNKEYKIYSDYMNTLTREEITATNQIIPQPISFDPNMVFEISKFYNVVNSQSA